MKKVLITDFVHPVLIDRFESAGYECHYFPKYTQEDVDDKISSYYGIIINSKTKIFKKQIDLAHNLKFVGRLGSGMEIIDIEYAAKNGIKSFSVPEANKDAVAEHAIGMLLSLFNNLNRADASLRNNIWEREKNRGIELGGKTIAIIGYGNTGKALAKKLSGFDVKVLAYDKYLEDYTDIYATEASMKTIFEQADVVSFHLPLTKETENMCDEVYINQFKKPVFIINTARGAIISLEKLFFLLETKKILGLCLDVFVNEKLLTFTTQEKKMYQKLFSFDSVILSPHIAGWTFESNLKIGKFLSEKIISYYK